jgi:hypothetical protein
MRAGTLCIASAVIGGFGLAAWALVARANRAIDDAFAHPFGDIAGMPAAAERIGGEGSRHGDRLAQNDIARHRKPVDNL